MAYTMSSFLTTGGIRGGKTRVGWFQPRSFNMGFSRVVWEKTRGFVFDRFAENVQQLPLSDQSLFIRAYFRFPHPERRPGYVSATLLQRMRRFIENRNAGNYQSYQDLGLKDYLASE